jgi:peptidoglycan/LPS O-acetylase OafA/YrhL
MRLYANTCSTAYAVQAHNKHRHARRSTLGCSVLLAVGSPLIYRRGHLTDPPEKDASHCNWLPGTTPQRNSRACERTLAAMPLSDLEPAYQQYLITRTFGSLNGLRGLCILAVIWHHVPVSRYGGALSHRGFLGVDMFFVLSGFLIVTLLLREHGRTGSISLRRFYARRTLRIMPIYYMLILMISMIYMMIRPYSESAQNYYHSLPFLLTYTSNWASIKAGNMGIMWSLATEEQFYLVWPAIEKFLRPWWVAVALAIVLVANQLVNFGVFNPLIATTYGAARPAILDVTFTPIALGVVLAHLLHTRETFIPMYRLLGGRGAALGMGAALVLLIAAWPGADIAGLGRLSIQFTMMLLLGSLVVREDRWDRPLLTVTPLRYLGVISYGTYMYHMWVIHAVRVGFERLGSSPEGVTFFIVTVLGCMVVAGMSYRFIEQPILKWKARFAA